MAAPETERFDIGTVICIDREKCEGVVRLEEDINKTTFQFNRSMIELDERYIADVIVGTQFFCEFHTDGTGARKLLQIYPRETMNICGVIKEIRRLEGVAEVTPELLATPVVFSRAHLDHPDDFNRIHVGDKVRIELEFYNLISKRKPPRATRVLLLEDSQKAEPRLRPALRRSSSISGRVPSSEPDEYTTSRRRSSSHSRSLDQYQLPILGSHQYQEADFNPGPVSSPLYSRQNHPMFRPTPARGHQLHAHRTCDPQFGLELMALHYSGHPAAFMPPPGFMPQPIHRVPYGHAYQGPPAFHPAGPLHGRGSWVPPSHPEEYERLERERSRRELLTSVLSRPVGSLRERVDDSDVVIEVTIDELRRLVLERPGSRSRDRDHDQ